MNPANEKCSSDSWSILVLRKAVWYRNRNQSDSEEEIEVESAEMFLRFKFRPSKISVRESENEKLIRIRIRNSAEILFEVVVICDPDRVHLLAVLQVYVRPQRMPSIFAGI